MNVNVIEVIRSVLTDINVIIAAVAVVLYLNFVVYVVRYRKKPPKIKSKKRVVAPAAPAPAATEEESE